MTDVDWGVVEEKKDLRGRSRFIKSNIQSIYINFIGGIKMDKNDLKELKEIFAPMTKYYSMLLKEKEDSIRVSAELQTEWSNYALVVKAQIKKNEKEIIIDSKGKYIRDGRALFDSAWEFLKRKQYVPYKSVEGIDFWSFLRTDFKLLDLLDKMILEINLLEETEKKEELRLFIDKYFLIAQEEQAKQKFFVIDNTWLTGKVHNNGDVIPKLSNTGAIVNILKAKLRLPKGKIRKSIGSKLTRAIGDRDRWKCKHCDADLSTKTSAWEVNHIDCNPANNDPKNLELTCRNCNKKYRL